MKKKDNQLNETNNQRKRNKTKSDKMVDINNDKNEYINR